MYWFQGEQKTRLFNIIVKNGTIYGINKKTLILRNREKEYTKNLNIYISAYK